MTTTTATAKLHFLPDNGTTKTVADTEISAMWLNGAGWKVQARKDGLTTSSTLVAHEHEALAAFNALVEQAEAAQPAEAPATQPVKLAPAAKGSQTKVSDPGHTILVVAALNGRVDQGGQPGQATVLQLKALAKRGYLALTYQQGRSDARKVVTGGVITATGRTRLAQLTADEREAAEKAARLAVVLTYATAA